jgi:uncharacterized protein (UPF0335 family)
MAKEVQPGGDPDKAVIESYIQRIENLKEDIASQQGKYMKVCADMRQDIADVYAEAKGKGLSVKALRTTIKIRERARKNESDIAKLEGEDRDSYDAIEEALGGDKGLGGTGLGAAALSKVKKSDGRPAAH